MTERVALSFVAGGVVLPSRLREGGPQVPDETDTIAPDEDGDYDTAVLADPEAEPDFTPGELNEPVDADDDGHDLVEAR